MSAVANPPSALDDSAFEPKPTTADPVFEIVDFILSIFGSQKIAVAMFVYGIFVILVGTLAQTEKDIWQVVPEYFRTFVMWVDINLFFPPAFFPGWKRLDVPLIPLPGGFVVGTVMIFNILFAHARWLLQLKTKFVPLVSGVGLMALGWLVTLLIILNGHNRGGFQAQPPFSWEVMWTGFQLLVLASWVCAVFGYVWGVGQPLVAALQKQQVTAFRSAMAILFLAGLLGYSIFCWFVLMRWGFPGAESLRIPWQLAQGTVAGVILLLGSWLVFQKRGGVVLLHQGLLLLMLNELFVSRYAIEYNMQLAEGETSNYLRDARATELAFIDRSKADVDEHIVIPGSLLMANARANAKNAKPTPIADPKGELPVNVTVLNYYRNADLKPLAKDEKTPATSGVGLKEKIEELPIAKGTDTDARTDMAAAYVQFTDKKTGADLGTYLLAQLAGEFSKVDDMDKVETGGQKFAVALRFQRQYVPFTIQLLDVAKDDYVGTNTPKNYSSDIVLKDSDNGVDSKVHIKMNDPLRYSGLTIYQSGYNMLQGGLEMTTLAVVRNEGWLIPYVALMIITVGMVAHFLMTLTRFLRRREAEELARRQAGPLPPPPGLLKPKKEAKKPKELQPLVGNAAAGQTPWLAYSIASLSALLIMVLVVGPALRSPKVSADQIDWEAAGQLPVAFGGRVMPVDTLARVTLLQLRQRETAKTKDGDTIPATQWFFDLITASPNAISHRVFKIDNPDIKKVFELEEDRKGHLYSTEDLLPKIKSFEDQVRAARKLQREKKELTIQQRRLLVLDGQLSQYMLLVQAFNGPRLSSIPERGDSEAEIREKIMIMQQEIMQSKAALSQANPPLAIPRAKAEKDENAWQSFHDAWIMWLLQTEFQQQTPDPATDGFIRLKGAYANYADARAAVEQAKADKKSAAEITRLEEAMNKAVEPFNTAVKRYESVVARTAPPEYSPYRLSLETWMNRVSPFYLGTELYIIAFLLAAIGWLIPSKSFNWASFSLVVLTFGLHTAALVMRIYISGRPPVTNLYSSAVFIGWGCVLLGIIIEMVYRIGLGNLVATTAGFATLIIAYFLGMGGDTIGVMQAVLDTQFWLATHVVCITLGYTATFVAGLLGVGFVILGMATPHLDAGMRKNLGRMIYGITCFAMFFSFFGTVLGGLWADDSWGRFWGWDPKENGALIIVLWNALLLHARWDKMVADRGLALLAIGGNIVTAWSWFGVNELGIGLHSYGFTDGVLFALGMFVLSQLVLILAGMAPMTVWWSVRKESPPGVA